ncbi:MAG: YncE family protein [Rhodobacteraceae bacterium]|nr:YncE family protein [Paracoccaceae bacterium]
MRTSLILGAAVIALLAAAAAYWLWPARPVPVVFGNLHDYAFLPSGEMPEMAVLSAADDTYVGKVTLPFVPDTVLVAPQVLRIVLISEATRTIALYNLQRQAVESTLTLDFVPANPVLSPDGQQLALADMQAGVVGFVDLVAGVLRARTDGLSLPEHLAFDGDSTLLFVPDNAAHEIVVIDSGDGNRWDPILLPAGSAPADLSALTRTPDGRFGLVSDAGSGRVHVIGFYAWAVIRTLEVGTGPGRAYGTADGQFMLVASEGDASVTVIDTDAFDIVARLPGMRGVTSIATGFFENLAYLISETEEAAVVIDLAKLAVVGRLDLPGRPGIAVADVDGKKIYVPLTGSGKLALIDVHKIEVAKIFPRLVQAPHVALLAVSNNYCH